MREASAKEAASGSWALRAALALAAVGVVTVLYWLFAAGAKLDETGYRRFGVGALEGLQSQRDPPPQPQAPLTRADGAVVTLQDFRGEVVLVNLWATWCAPCVEEMPSLAALQRAFPEGFAVVPVSVDPAAQGEKAAARLAELSGGALPFLHDPSYAIAYAAKAGGFPTSILYDRRGKELARLAKGADWDTPEARRLIEAALAEP